MYSACSARSVFKTASAEDYILLHFNSPVAGEVECFHYKEKTFANCETRTAFTAYRDATSDLYNFGYQHYFYDKVKLSKVDCWDYVGYPTMLDCKTRSTYVKSTPAPVVAADIVRYYFKHADSSTYYECFDYSPDYDYCKKRLAVVDPATLGITLNENYW